MNSAPNAVIESWTLNAFTISILLCVASVYLRGWFRVRRLVQTDKDAGRLAAFLAGLFIVFLSTESPLDTFDMLYLSAHMSQHLLLMMIAPPLILLGDPAIPLLRGLPKPFVKEALGPFLSWPLLKNFSGWLVSPPVAWIAFAFSTIFWHLPKFYEVALSSSFWHGAQHASFFWTGILFWWPILQRDPRHSRWPLWLNIPYLLSADLVNTALSAAFVFSGRLLYPSYGLVRASAFNAQDDQTVAGLIMWVPGSLVFLVPAFAIAMQLFSSQNRMASAVMVRRVSRVERSIRGIRASMLPKWRRLFQSAMLLVALLVMADGWFGPQVTPLNMAGVLPWIHWRALSVLALLVVGNLFCMGCPFTLVRDIGRKVLPARLRWPRSLRNKWLPIALFVLYLWCYEAFGLWDSPALTAWTIAGYFAAALVIDGLFRGASFCKYVCPIGQFHFVTSLVSPREVKIRSEKTCQSCQTFDCIKGNAQARGCELYLFQPKKSSSMDCTFCLDCVKACPHDNVAILPVLPAQTLVDDPYRSSLGRLSKRSDLAALALVFVFGAFSNAAGMIAPVMAWEHRLHARFGPHAMPLIVGGFTLTVAVLLPLALVALCGLANRLTDRSIPSAVDLARRLCFTLVPLGVSMWAAHLLYHFATGWSTLLPVINQRLLHVQSQIAMPSVPDWLSGMQIILLDAGLLLTLWVAWRIVRQVTGRTRFALELLTPWMLCSAGLYIAGAWILFQPMQMRGMMH